MECKICGRVGAKADLGADTLKQRLINGKCWIRCYDEKGEHCHSEYRYLSGKEWNELIDQYGECKIIKKFKEV